MIPLSDKSALRLTIARYYTPSGRSIHRDEKKNTGGITPDIEIKVPLEVERKLLQQAEEFYYPGKEPKAAEEAEKKRLGEKTSVPQNDGVFRPTAQDKKKEAQIRDDVLDRAVELLKAREVLGNLKTAK
ncbi:MAG TPA: hypothetical protein DEF68_06415 [Elusimicrobia bacterium]|nr:hypothetical protein [Elusimicrobiota bacterium]